MKNSDEGWIKIFRKMQEWEWYTDSYMVHLLLHLSMTAGTQPVRFRGITVDRGQRACTLQQLSFETGISVSTLKRDLDRLQECDAIEHDTSHNFHLITVKNYEKYQSNIGSRIGSRNSSDIGSDIRPDISSEKANKRANRRTNAYIEQEDKKKKESLSLTPCVRESRLQELEEAHVGNALNNQSWKESVMMRHKLTTETFDLEWQEFILDCKASNKTHDSENDVQDHFNKWLTNKQYYSNGRYKQKAAEEGRRSSLDRRRPHEVSHKGTEDYTEAL